MKILLVSGSNSLSHLFKCLSMKKHFEQKKCIVYIAVSEQYVDFLKSIDENNYFVLPNIQENDKSGFPTVYWFKNISWISICIKSERELIKKMKPDMILGVFHFTIKISSHLENIPFYSLSCGCMLPEFQGALGFNRNDSSVEIQKNYLNTFFKYAAVKMNKATSKFDFYPLEDIRFFLKGKITFLWDFPEFMQSAMDTNIVYAGPVPMINWPKNNIDISKLNKQRKPLAVISFGTCCHNIKIFERLINILTQLNFYIVIAGGLGEEISTVINNNPNTVYVNEIPLKNILKEASVIISHGGQMTIFESIAENTPVIVMPFHPEQDHNGLCLENIGCGKRLIQAKPFNSQPEYYINRFNALSDSSIKSTITLLLEDRKIEDKLKKYKEIINSYNSLETIYSELERQ